MSHSFQQSICAGVVLLLGFLSLAPAPARAQDVSISAAAERTTVREGDLVSYVVRVEGADRNEVRQPQAPPADGLDLVRAQPNVHHQLALSGTIRQSHSFQWHYRPTRPGRVRIGGAQVTVDGRSYQTAPVEIEVLPASAANSSPPGRQGTAGGGQAEARFSGRDLFIQAVPSTRTPFLNEQVILEYRLFFQDGIRIRNSVLADSWDTDGFWREEMTVDATPVANEVVVDGQRYRSILLKRVALFPTRTGRLEVEPFRIQTEAFTPYAGGSDPFGNLFSLGQDVQVVEVASPPVTLDVKPLPAGAPAGFAGAVGSYRMEMTPPATQLDVGDPLEIRAVIAGSGNFATMPPPALELPAAFERFEPQASTTLLREGNRLHGSKTFTYVAVPRRNGAYTLPPVVFSYFNPGTGRYETLSSEPATVRVTGAAAEATADGSSAQGMPADDIAGLMPSDEWVRLDRTPLHRAAWPYILLLLPALALGGTLFVRHARRVYATKSEVAKSDGSPRALRRRITRLSDLRDPRRFYEEIEHVLLDDANRRLRLSGRMHTRRELDAALAQAEVSDAVRAEVHNLLAECDAGRFAPGPPDLDKMRTAPARLEHVLAEIDRAALRTESTVRT